MKRTGLHRRTPLVARTPLLRRTPLRRTSSALTRSSGVKGRPAGGESSAPARGLARSGVSTGPDWNTVEAVLERDSYSCAWCGLTLIGERSRDWSIQHRRPRRAGGDPRPDTNLPSNLVALHGSGTTLCHGYVESQRLEALDTGFLLHADTVPSRWQINHAVHGRCRLTDDGRVKRIEEVGA